LKQNKSKSFDNLSIQLVCKHY